MATADVQVISIGPAELAEIEIIGGGGGGPVVVRLDDLVDVTGADAGSPGQALVKGGDGVWIPQSVLGGSGGQSYFHVQDTPSTVWLIGHGLGFNPAGIVVRDLSNNAFYPDVEYIDIFTVRLTFGVSVRGTAHLS